MRFTKCSANCLALALLFPVACSGASIDFEGFDFKQCARWYISSDSYPSPDVDLEGNKNFRRADAILAKVFPNRIDGEWGIYSAHDFAHPKMSAKFGACRLSDGGRDFECLPGFDFPISGTKYAVIKYKGQLPSLNCVMGCKKVDVKMLHDMGYENMEDERNIEHELNLKKFNRTCNKKVMK